MYFHFSEWQGGQWASFWAIAIIALLVFLWAAWSFFVGIADIEPGYIFGGVVLFILALAILYGGNALSNYTNEGRLMTIEFRKIPAVRKADPISVNARNRTLVTDKFGNCQAQFKLTDGGLLEATGNVQVEVTINKDGELKCTDKKIERKD